MTSPATHVYPPSDLRAYGYDPVKVIHFEAGHCVEVQVHKHRKNHAVVAAKLYKGPTVQRPYKPAGIKLPNEIHVLKSILPPHKNIIDCLEVWEDVPAPDHYFLVLLFCNAGTVMHLKLGAQAAGQLVPQNLIWHLFIQATEAIEHCHKHGIPHGDAHAGNLFLTFPNDFEKAASCAAGKFTSASAMDIQRIGQSFIDLLPGKNISGVAADRPRLQSWLAAWTADDPVRAKDSARYMIPEGLNILKGLDRVLPQWLQLYFQSSVNVANNFRDLPAYVPLTTDWQTRSAMDKEFEACEVEDGLMNLVGDVSISGGYNNDAEWNNAGINDPGAEGAITMFNDPDETFRFIEDYLPFASPLPTRPKLRTLIRNPRIEGSDTSSNSSRASSSAHVYDPLNPSYAAKRRTLKKKVSFVIGGSTDQAVWGTSSALSVLSGSSSSRTYQPRTVKYAAQRRGLKAKIDKARSDLDIAAIEHHALQNSTRKREKDLALNKLNAIREELDFLLEEQAKIADGVWRPEGPLPPLPASRASSICSSGDERVFQEAREEQWHGLSFSPTTEEEEESMEQIDSISPLKVVKKLFWDVQSGRY